MIKEERIITRNNLKQLCIDFDLYTLIEVLTVETKIRVEKTQETIK